MRLGRIGLPDYLTPLFKTPYSEVFKIRTPDNDASVAEIKYADRAKFPINQQDGNSDKDSSTLAEIVVSFNKSIRQKLSKKDRLAEEIVSGHFSKENLMNLATCQETDSNPKSSGYLQYSEAQMSMLTPLVWLKGQAQEVLLSQKDIEPGRVLALLR